MAPNKFRRSIHARVTPACPHSTSARIRTPRQLSLEANLILSPLRAVLGWQCATCSMQLASCILQASNDDVQKRNIQDAADIIAAMQHTTRCMATPAPSVSCVFGPLSVDVVAWECRTVRFQCLMLARTVVPLKSTAHTQCRRANASHQGRTARTSFRV